MGRCDGPHHYFGKHKITRNSDYGSCIADKMAIELAIKGKDSTAYPHPQN